MNELPSASEVTSQDVFKNIGPKIAYVSKVVYRWSARVHADGLSIGGSESFDGTGQCVGQFEHFEFDEG
jgi:hypothetical protein